MDQILNYNDVQIRFDDFFTYIDTLGQGAFGIVVKAINNLTKEIVAVKVIQKAVIKRFENLEQEAEIFSQLNHSNIVKFYDIKRTDTKILIEMELINGGTLQKQMEQRKLKNCWFKNNEIKIIISGILRALSYIHENHFVHRDLKPENILIEENLSTIKIADFGLSSQHTKYGLMQKKCGTLTYMAPELLQKKVYNKNVDIWSVGIIMYQLLNNGQHPYYVNGQSQDQLLQSIQDMHKNLDYSLMDSQQISLFQRMTEIDQSKRYSAFQALLHPWINEKRQMIPQNFTEILDQWLLTQKSVNIIKCLMIIALLKNNTRITRKKYVIAQQQQFNLIKTDQSDEMSDLSPYNQTKYLLNFIKIKQQKKSSKQSDFSSTNTSPIVLQSTERQDNSNAELLLLHSILPDIKYSKESPGKIQRHIIKRNDSQYSKNSKNGSQSPKKTNITSSNKQPKIMLRPLPTQVELCKETQTVDLYKSQQQNPSEQKKGLNYKQSAILDPESEGYSPTHTKTNSLHYTRTSKYKTEIQNRQRRILSSIEQKKNQNNSNNLNYFRKKGIF